MLLLKVSAICTYISVVFSWLCPNSSFTIFKSVPCSIRCVANECRNRWGYTRLVIPASFAASFSFFDTMLSVNGSPLYRSNSHCCGLYSLVYWVQLLDKGLRQQRVAVLFPPFALPYPYQRTAHVDVVWLQVQQLADSQPGGVEQREHAEQPDVRTGCVKDGFYLLLAQHVGQRPFPFGSLYLVTFPFQSQHLLEIKLDRVDAQVLLARRDPPCVNQVYDVGVDFFRSDVAEISSRKVLLELLEVSGVCTDGMLAGCSGASGPDRAVRVHFHFDGISHSNDSQLSLKPGTDGRLTVCSHGILDPGEVRRKTVFGYDITDSDRQVLRQTGNMGHPAGPSPTRAGEQVEALVQP